MYLNITAVFMTVSLNANDCCLGQNFKFGRLNSAGQSSWYPKHGKYEFLADLKKFVTLSSFPHYGEKAKNDKVLDYKAVQSFTAMKTVSELYKNMNWLISKSLEFFF